MFDTETQRRGDLQSLVPFSPEALAVCTALSELFLKQSERPDLVALGFWLRESHIRELQAVFVDKQRPGVFLVPRGVVFHIPPANVEAMAIYSWIISLLVGNANIIRWPSNSTPLLRGIVEEILPLVGQNTRFVFYGHQEEITRELSAEADVRIIWGGDETIRAIREIPLQPRAKEIVFADRSSLALIDASAYLKATEEAKQRLSLDFYNDTFWFDQRACSSPRSVVWVGEKVEEARELFYEHLIQTIALKGYTLPVAARLEKITHTYVAAMEANRVRVWNNELTVIYADDLPTEHCGFGLLYDLHIPHLEALSGLISKKEQTLSYFGVSVEALQKWTRSLNGGGIDRIVLMGQALQFDLIWDGYDLFEELTTKVSVN